VKSERISLSRVAARRSAVRNLKRSRVQDSVAMRISGHLTRSVFDRYNMTDGADVEDAKEKLEGI
jgi:hypothetical protein